MPTPRREAPDDRLDHRRRQRRLAALAILGYLLYTLIRPERF
jgi:K+-transporting ATPase KdpF subunit